ncbi:MAG: ATP12 family chaperone protein [Hyphomonadaceae bacterium]
MSSAPRKFYEFAAPAQVESGFAVALDGRPIKTPAGKPFRVRTIALAEAVAAEWNGQGEEIRPASMPLTRMMNVAIDRTPAMRAELIAEIARYGQTDLLCHRAESPEKLVARQAAAWDPWVRWANEAIGFRPEIVIGVRAAENDVGPIAAAAAEMDDARLTALAHAVGLAGSAILALALLDGRIDAETAFAAAALDDLYQLEVWGEDAEARARLDRLKGEFTDLGRFIAALA